MARKKKLKIKEPEKLWEIPEEVIQKRIEHLQKNFPGSYMLKTYQAEIARSDRSKPMRLDEEDE